MSRFFNVTLRSHKFICVFVPKRAFSFFEFYLKHEFRTLESIDSRIWMLLGGVRTCTVHYCFLFLPQVKLVALL